jgi:hypothetical protein
MEYSGRYLAYMGLAPKRIPHWEHWSCPDAETYLTGIDYYQHPRLCRLKLRELYPQLELPVPENDNPLPRPQLDLQGQTSTTDDQGRRRVRWGQSLSDHWEWGCGFKTAEDVFAFSPLEPADVPGNTVIAELRSCLDEEKLYQNHRKLYPPDRGDRAPEGSTDAVGFYNTMFMWPLRIFGWELFLETCLDPRFERLMDEFAEVNRRVFRAFARLPVNFAICHDDIVNSRGPVCSPAWMRRYIFPRYEEYWGLLRAAGKHVLFMADGRMDACADDVFACGARGIITEPHTDFKTIARKHENCFLAGEGDNRTLTRNDPAEIEAMVRSMVETANLTGGYMMCIGNHLPWNVTPQGIKRYLDLSAELAHR